MPETPGFQLILESNVGNATNCYSVLRLRNQLTRPTPMLPNRIALGAGIAEIPSASGAPNAAIVEGLSAVSVK